MTDKSIVHPTSTCSVCRRTEQILPQQGLYQQLPRGWAIVAVHVLPITSQVVCESCLFPVQQLLKLR